MKKSEMLLNKLSEDEIDKIKDYIWTEVNYSLEQQEGYRDNLTRWEELYDGVVKPKNFPWEKCANVRTPLVAVNVEAIFARMLNSIFATENYWMIQPLMPGTYTRAKELEAFLSYYSNHALRLYEVCQDWFLSGVKYGTGVVKVYWKEQYDYKASRTPFGVTYKPVLRYRGPKVDAIPINDFLRPSGYKDVQSMPWVGNKFRLNYFEMKQHENDGYYLNVEEVIDKPDNDISELDHLKGVNVGVELGNDSTTHGTWELWEVSFKWNYNGIFIPLMAVFHPETKTLLHLDYFPFDHCRWPYCEFRYMPREGMFEGIGVIGMLEQSQNTMDTIINQTIDNATIANSKIFAVKKNTGLPKNMSVYPGKIFHVEEPGDIQAIPLGEGYSSNPTLLRMVQDWGERRSGLTDYSLGRESSVIGSRATATSTMALIQEANRRFDLTLKDIRNSSTEIGYMCLELWQQYSDTAIPYMVREQSNQEVLWKQLEMEDVDFRNTYMVELSASRASLNREVEKQNYLALFQLMTGYYSQVIQLAGQLDNPNAPPSFKAAAIQVGDAAAELGKRVFENYDIRDAAMLVPVLGDIYEGTRNQAGTPNGINAMGQNQVPPGPGGNPLGSLQAGAFQQLGGVPGEESLPPVAPYTRQLG